MSNQSKANKYILIILKGMGMGAANVIPGVSGGTIALITGIYEELINSIKSFNLSSIKLLFCGKFKEFSKNVNLPFLSSVFIGIGISIISIAKLLEFLFHKNELLVWSFFFGLILASIYFVGRMVKNWNMTSLFTLILGTSVAIGLAFLKPVSENSSIWYLFICGIVAVASMILPGLSGSYVLILMGNYQLIMLDSVSDPFHHLHILFPVIIGSIIGFLVLSHGISFVLNKFYDATIAMLTGFVIGSLLIIWPWKTAAETMIGRNGEEKVVSYSWNAPVFSNTEDIYAIGTIVIGVILVYLIEKLGSKFNSI